MKIIYHREIDGLRAIAVIAVIIYHSKIKIFNIDFLSGGFLGVDIFFFYFRLFNYYYYFK